MLVHHQICIKLYLIGVNTHLPSPSPKKNYYGYLYNVNIIYDKITGGVSAEDLSPRGERLHLR